MAKKNSKEKHVFAKSVQIKNRRASFEYHFLDTYIAGVVLQGSEIKSIRMGKVNMQDAYCYFKNGELWVKQLNISTYTNATYNNHEPTRERKLLLSKRELKKLEERLEEQGLTVIPTRVFINDRGWAKMEVALAKGKKLYDKRDSLKEKDLKREIDRTKY
ncbi:SsrA-binding protein SmpB [Eisenibacter elegans]|jgi:SsrA-binding protein|uniref:SsrA-binding protein SmpB n=1 Tax=Eisenibacter elegans TaxID=997 RepID=UPI00042A59C9|nr:SsrA-binding protein SmpB [Eisenibacter elegans]